MDAILIILGAIFCLMRISALFKFGAWIIKGIWNIFKAIGKGFVWLFRVIFNR